MAMQVLDIEQAVEFSRTDLSQGTIPADELAIMEEWRNRKLSLQSEMDRFQNLCDRWDDLYYPETVLANGGASHWAWHPSARVPGRTHVSLNSPPVYVDLPASLQSQTPVENMVATRDEDTARKIAALVERSYFAWKDEVDFELKAHQACVVKGLYGRTAAKVWWDQDKDHPVFDVIDQPRNLWMGWGQSDYKSLNWAAYVYRLTPESVYEEYGLITLQKQVGNRSYPYLVSPTPGDLNPSIRTWLLSLEGMVEVADYWYRKPVTLRAPNKITSIKHETWNAIIVGNRVVKNSRHSEYGGRIPYVPLFNSYIPGVPDGRPEFYDIEQLFHEKDERLTATSQMQNNVVNGQFWQLVGPEAPDEVPPGLKPTPNRVVAPGSGNRIETIQPWFPEFQSEQYLQRLDRELQDLSGLSDLMRGMAPEAIISSSKAINAIVTNYETRIRLKRDLFYRWRKSIWEMATDVWVVKQPQLRPIMKGHARLEQTPPSLTPRDDMEAAQMAANLKTQKIWSGKRAMDRAGVDDPEAEEAIIRAEQTDATLNPAAVQVMVQLMAVIQQIQAQQQQQAMAQQQQQAQQVMAQQGQSLQQGLAGYRTLEGGMAAPQSMNGPGEQPAMSPEAAPGNTPPGQEITGPPGPEAAAGPPTAQPGSPQFQAQNMLQGGEAKNRILTSQQL